MHRRALVAVCLLAVTMMSAVLAKEPSKPQRPVVRIAQPIKRELADEKQFVGRTAPLESVDLRPRVTSVVSKVHFAAGQRVRKGDVLFELDPRFFQAKVAAAEASVANAAAGRAKADMAVSRAQQLRETRTVSAVEVDVAMADRDQANATLAAAKATLDLAQLDLSFTTIEAPIDGTMGSPLVTVGNTAKADTTLLATLVSLDPLAVEFDVDQRTALELRGSPGFEVTLDLPDRNGGVLRSRGQAAANQLDPDTRTRLMRALVPNNDEKLLPGLALTVRVATTRPRTVMLIAPAALGKDAIGDFVYVVSRDDASPQSNVERRRVSIDGENAGLRIVTEGLTPDDWVVLGGLDLLRPEMAVDPQRTPMPQPNTSLRIKPWRANPPACSRKRRFFAMLTA